MFHPSIFDISLMNRFFSTPRLIRCVFLWGFYAFYCNRVVKGDYGQTLPWYFLFTKSYWCGSKVSAEDDSLWEEREATPGVPMEPVSNALKEQENQGMGVHIRGLTKKFGEKTAVDDLALSMYEGQVFALLGHNGAGKKWCCTLENGSIPDEKLIPTLHLSQEKLLLLAC